MHVSDAGRVMEAIDGCTNYWSAICLNRRYEFLGERGFARGIWPVDSDSNGVMSLDLDDPISEVNYELCPFHRPPRRWSGGPTIRLTGPPSGTDGNIRDSLLRLRSNRLLGGPLSLGGLAEVVDHNYYFASTTPNFKRLSAVAMTESSQLRGFHPSIR